MVYPCRYLLQLLQPGLTIPLPPLLFDNDQTALRENFNMQRNRLAAHIKVLRDRIYVQWLTGHHFNNLPPRRVGYRLKNVSPDFQYASI